MCRDLERVCLLGLKCKFLVRDTISISSAHELLPAIISHQVECFDRNLTYKTQLKQLVGKNLIHKTHSTFQFEKNLSHKTLCLSGERLFKYKTHPHIRHVSYYRDSTVVIFIFI